MRVYAELAREEQEALDKIDKHFKLGSPQDAIRFSILYADRPRWHPDMEWLGYSVIDTMSSIQMREDDKGSRIAKRWKVPPRATRKRDFGLPPKPFKIRRHPGIDPSPRRIRVGLTH